MQSWLDTFCKANYTKFAKQTLQMVREEPN